ncbi:hypothetical protein D6850_11520 [Roseovarius spongiae]|uniref:Uncharacterized protein n=1 Tax=Roseovarius spongiae TaxID=2320272 RepID=A0A3A8AUP0_9RHOB|nr:hypothetical protein [Roseovarius spongiae]RKF13823.1 hypothetical protein D6850_11520 [Roseovarius spongiae]
MFHKRNAIDAGRATALALIMGMGIAAAPAAAQQLKMNIGCPTLGSADIGNYTIDELNKLCHNNSGSASTGGSGSTSAQDELMASAEGGAALSCGQHKALAFKARLNPGFVEGEASQSVVDKYCQGKPDDALPDESYTGGDQVAGAFRFERGYNNHYSGAKGRICKSYYSGDAYLDNGRIQFTSGGHTWRGTISSNSYISVTRDGVTPRPKNPTSITGPMFNAELYNGYCGYGFFRLSAQ